MIERQKFDLTEKIARMDCSPLTTALNYLLLGQNPDGSWTDFWLPVGASDAWVTAFVGRAIYEASRSSFLSDEMRKIATRSALTAGQWLLKNVRDGWGYNGSVPSDADSTAHSLSLLAKLNLDVPEKALQFLERHHVPGKGYKTFCFHHPQHRWTGISPDITAAALRALYETNRMNREELADHWRAYLCRQLSKRGFWKGYWWIRPSYPTGLVLEVWSLADKPDIALKLYISSGMRSSPFETAWILLSYLRLQQRDAVSRLCRRLLRLQSRDGAWPSDPILRVPPHHDGTGGLPVQFLARDAKRLFTTASILRSLVLCLEKYPDMQKSFEEIRTKPGHRRLHSSGCGLKDLIGKAAGNAGFGPDSQKQIQNLFGCLTRTSLSPGNPWPSSQLSALAAGVPLEFSCRLMADEESSLRYTVEAGNPYLPPYPRARSALRDIQEAAEFLEYETSWERIEGAVSILVAPEIAVSNDTKFWIWTGVNHKENAAPGLKIYVSLFGDRDSDCRKRLESSLRAASISYSRSFHRALNRLNRCGFLQEVGFGLGPAGAIACKVYYELQGWRPGLIEELLESLELPADLSLLRPEIPRLLKESLAKKNRSGIAFRINPEDGVVSELTVSAAFLPAMLPPREIQNRLEAWIRNQNWDGRMFSRLARVLVADGEDFPVKQFSLFTRTVSRKSNWTTVYIRPLCSTAGWTGKPKKQKAKTYFY